MERKYIPATEFRDFGSNQKKLIGVLNHSVTKLSVDVEWLKKLNVFQVSILTGILIVVVCGFLKIALI